eukprot:180180-Prymnesium_polylepis.1
MAVVQQQADGERLLRACGAGLAAVAAEAAAMLASPAGAADGGRADTPAADLRRAVSSVEGRLQLEAARHAQQLERL